MILTTVLRRLTCLLVTVTAVLVPHGARAQDPLESFEFSFSNPGARSMGFGGAFVAIADDPTAAFANPGGLVKLVRPEAFIELRLTLELEYDLTGSGIEEVKTDATGLSFFSFAFPMGRCSAALYGHRAATFELNDLEGGGPVILEDGTLTELEISRYAVSGACRVSDRLSLGVGVSYFDGKLNVTGTSQRSADWGLNAGILWSPVDRLSLGGFFREGPQLDVGGDVGGTMSLPDAYGLGAAIRSSNGRFTLSGEWDRVEYSTLLSDLDVSATGQPAAVLDDANELHLGGEYVWITTSKVIALRFGAWLDPDHVVRSSDGAQGEDEYHGAAGFGLAWEKFQLDFAVDFSSEVFTMSASGILVF